jgi:dolichol-phosphate mannosyltransferase
MSPESNLREMELKREAYWLRYPVTSPIKLRWRASAVKHCFHVLPGETILELGAGSGLWTQRLTEVLAGWNPITAAVFNEELLPGIEQKELNNVKAVCVNDLAADFAPGSFDYIVGTAILCHTEYQRDLKRLYRLLKPGGQILFFEANHWNPQVFIKSALPWLGRMLGQARCYASMRKFRLMKAASQEGFIQIEVIPFDIVHPRFPIHLIRFARSLSYVFEHAPLIREVCGTLYIWAKKPGGPDTRPFVDLAEHSELCDSTSIVVPCYNEEMNIPRLVQGLVGMYDRYIHEIIIVNDNSRDRTAQVTLEVAKSEPRVKLVDRTPPNGVGRALRDGYAAATGRYILTMDSDFVLILPELKDLFDSIARGKDGAIGSRFSYDSILMNYPFPKIVANRAFHLLANILLPIHCRDVSNNLKLYRADILRNLTIEEPHFAANAETGLKPLMAGYDIEEVPISWINRTLDMGSSTFKVAKVAPGYFFALLSIITKARKHKVLLSRSASSSS